VRRTTDGSLLLVKPGKLTYPPSSGTKLTTRIVTDNGLVEKLYNPSIKAWFGDKGDGVHTGGPEDPRMAVIEVVPDEIRHYHQERSGLGVLGEVVAATITGNTASPGSIRTITREELATVA
jgi:general stress protein 26